MDQSTQEHNDLNSGDGDCFYEELKRQILQLTADDDNAREDYAIVDHRRNKISISKKRTSSDNMASYFDWTCNEKTSSNTVPACIQNLWRNGKIGTGVFIPEIVMPRRRNKPRRRKNDRGRTSPPENRMINI
ncbi:hypothetical protein POM88_030765 [Heracleum sosnowskyi]|uniref:Uncharacterized protein n=1 Tax=Heracleum sosnowskyi TaxID=360622 RepID=A0AAD8HW46_9APIA|nr:hypothetical protein POM88_030765 [Heracleum sosnowskyi]